MNRTHNNGELTIKNVGEKVELVGWVAKRRNLGKLLFIDLRDRTGIVQLLIKEGVEVPDVRNEYVIHVTGTVCKKDVPNKALKTGDIEVDVESLEVLVEFSDNGDFAIYDVEETVNDRKHSIMLNGEQEYITDIQINDLTNSGIAEDGLECYEITLKMASFIGDCDVRISLIQL